MCVDEMTGIQAIERKEKDLPLRPGKVKRQEFEYIRHGTQALIANFNVVTGEIIHPTCGDTRTEEDEAQNIRKMLESDPDAKKWNLIMDCLNTHQSESLVRLVAEKEGGQFFRYKMDKPFYQPLVTPTDTLNMTACPFCTGFIPGG